MSETPNFPVSDPDEGNRAPEKFPSSEPNPACAEPPDAACQAKGPQENLNISSVKSAECSAKCAAASQGAPHSKPAVDRRRRRRALISAPVRVRGAYTLDPGPDEISTTIDVSRSGLLVMTQLDTYRRGMDVKVVFPYRKSQTAIHAERHGRIARVAELPGGRRAIAIALDPREDLVRAGGKKFVRQLAPGPRKPLVLAVDADDIIRAMMKNYLENQGYNVIAVDNGGDAREVLKMFTPTLLIAEVEGEGMPGFDLCAHVKADPDLRHIPVLLTTRSGFPSDYSNAHALGAVVCMSKPYRQDRLGHVVRLLAPLPPEVENATAAKRGSNGSAGRKAHAAHGSTSPAPGNGNGSRRPRHESSH